MNSCDFEALEYTEFEAVVDLYRAASEGIRNTHAIEVRDFGATVCLSCRGVEPAMVFRRVVGLGVRQEAAETDLEEAISYMDSRGLAYAVAVAPRSRPAELAGWLERRKFSRGYAWMKFSRPCEGVPEVTSTLEIRVIGHEFGEVFGRVVAEGFELPPGIAPWIGALAGRPNWICVMAFDGPEPVATGAAYMNGEYAWLGLGATLPSHRRQGAQSALLALRLREAGALGARTAITETGEQLPGQPSNSYRNILRAGFEEMYLRQNYISSSRKPDSYER